MWDFDTVVFALLLAVAEPVARSMLDSAVTLEDKFLSWEEVGKGQTRGLLASEESWLEVNLWVFLYGNLHF